MKEKKYKIIAVLDTIEDKLIQQSLELIAFAESFSSGDLSGTLLVVPGKNVLQLCESISEKYGIDTAAIEHEGLYYPNPEILAEILPETIDEYKPELIVFTQTVRNCQSAAKLSVSIKSSSITAVESFTGDNDVYVFQRSIFNGKFKVFIRPRTSLKILTVLSGAYTLPENKIPYNKNASVLQKKNSLNVKGYKPVALSSVIDSGVKLEDADVIVSIGRGIGREENLELIRETAGIFTNSAVGASRPVCDQKWLPFNHQVGITGKTVSPKLYIACGISGSQQHIAGMKNSQCIVAINKDPNASIFSIADYNIIEDILSFLPVLLRKYYERAGD
jgi:electron transfer flavoprotein alpha subunit